jgi:acetyl esterase/lipase
MFVSSLILAGALFAGNPGPTLGNESYQVEQSLEIRYHDAHDRQVLDVLRPKGLEGRPVVIFVHGGAWIIGDKNLLGLYRGLGDSWPSME